MAHLTMIKDANLPPGICMTLPSQRGPLGSTPTDWPKIKFEAGTIYEVSDDDDVAYLLEMVHVGDDGVERHMFERPRDGAYGDADGRTDQGADATAAMLKMLGDGGHLSEEQLAKVQALLPETQTTPDEHKRVLQTCGSCNERIRAPRSQNQCPNCGGDIHSDGAITTRLLAQTGPPEDVAVDDRITEPEVADAPETLECVQCGFRPGDSGNQAKDRQKLNMHIRKSHGQA